MNRQWIDSRVAGQANVTVFGHVRQLRCALRGYRLPDWLRVETPRFPDGESIPPPIAHLPGRPVTRVGDGSDQFVLFSAKSLDTWARIDIIMVGLGGNDSLLQARFLFHSPSGKFGLFSVPAPPFCYASGGVFSLDHWMKMSQGRTSLPAACARVGRWDRNPITTCRRVRVRGN